MGGHYQVHSYLQAAKWREERAVIHGVRCLELLLGGDLENLFGGDSLELQSFLLLSLSCSQQWVFHGASVDLGCCLATELHVLKHLTPQWGQLHTFSDGWRMLHQALRRSS